MVRDRKLTFCWIGNLLILCKLWGRARYAEDLNAKKPFPYSCRMAPSYVSTSVSTTLWVTVLSPSWTPIGSVLYAIPVGTSSGGGFSFGLMPPQSCFGALPLSISDFYLSVDLLITILPRLSSVNSFFLFSPFSLRAVLERKICNLCMCIVRSQTEIFTPEPVYSDSSWWKNSRSYRERLPRIFRKFFSKRSSSFSLNPL